MNLIGQLSHVTGKLEDSLVVLEERCSDADPRVRTAAFDSLVRENGKLRLNKSRGLTTLFVLLSLSVCSAQGGTGPLSLGVLQGWY